MIELCDATFEKSLQKGKFLLMFYTEWCPLCPPILEMLGELEREEGGKFTFAKIELHSNPTAAKHFGVPFIPLEMAVIDGKALYGTAGLLQMEGYRMIVRELLYDFDENEIESKIGGVSERVAKLKAEQADEMIRMGL